MARRAARVSSSSRAVLLNPPDVTCSSNNKSTRRPHGRTIYHRIHVTSQRVLSQPRATSGTAIRARRSLRFDTAAVKPFIHLVVHCIKRLPKGNTIQKGMERVREKLYNSHHLIKFDRTAEGVLWAHIQFMAACGVLSFYLPSYRIRARQTVLYEARRRCTFWGDVVI